MAQFFGVLSNHISKYPSPRYINYSWGFGSVLGLVVALQVITGVLLACYYRPSSLTAFSDIVFIINDVNSGYIVKYLHLNGASAIFLFLYLHMFRGLFYKSYVMLPKVWLTGVILFLLMIITAFLGYVLPWGQMSFWAATVITNLVTSIPVVGQKLIVLIHGAFSVQDATLNRFFVLHYLLALVTLAVIIVHIFLLHSEGSTNPAGRLLGLERAEFYYYFAYKDLQFFAGAALMLVTLALLYPNALNHPDNFIEANPLVTPSHIVPEWYFLPFYAILRAIPNKLLGVVAMLLSLAALASLPAIVKPSVDVNDDAVASVLELFFYGILFSLLILGYLGSMPAAAPYVAMSQFFTAFYFLLFLVPAFVNYFAALYARAIKDIYNSGVHFTCPPFRRLGRIVPLWMWGKERVDLLKKVEKKRYESIVTRRSRY